MINIRLAIPQDAEALTELMHASAAYRGDYASILDGYAVTPSQIGRNLFYLAERDGRISGFYSLVLEGEPELDLLFVADEAQGMGLGAMLFRHMTEEAKRRGVAAITIVSHPPSIGFYQAMEATIIGTKPPTTKAKWSRPILMLTI